MIRELPAGKGFADIVLLSYRHVEAPAIVLELNALIFRCCDGYSFMCMVLHFLSCCGVTPVCFL